MNEILKTQKPADKMIHGANSAVINPIEVDLTQKLTVN